MSEILAGPAPETVTTLDVRELEHGQRHPLIFKTYDALKARQSFILVVDHDPKPVLFELEFVQNGKFKWSYLKHGPDVWQIQMIKSK